MEGKKPKCYNCKHAGKQFKLGGLTHMHCEHPKYTKEKYDTGEFGPYDTIQVFSDTCNEHEFKTK